MTGPLTCSVLESARLIGISRDAVYAAIACGELKVIKIGRTIRVPLESIEALMTHAAKEGLTL